MKKLILAFLLLMVLSVGFSDAISDFVKNNLNFVVAAFTFIVIFGISMGAANIWVENAGQTTMIALGVSVLISVLVLLNPNLTTILSSIIQYSPIFLIIFIIIFLVIIILFSKKKSWTQGIAIAVLIAAIAFIFFLNMNSEGGSGSGTGTGLDSAGPIIILILVALGIGGVVFVLVKKKLVGGNGGSSSSYSSGGGSNSSGVSVSPNKDSKKTILKGKVLDFRKKAKGVPMKGLKVTVTTDPGFPSLEDTTNRNGEFEIKLPETIPNDILIKKVEVEYSGKKYDHLMFNGKPDYSRNNRGDEFSLKKGNTMKGIIVPINKDSVPLAAGEARINGRVIQYDLNGKLANVMPAIDVTLINGANTKVKTTDSLGNFEITIPAADLAKYNGGLLTITHSGTAYNHTQMFGLFDDKRDKIQLKKGEHYVIIPIQPKKFRDMHEDADFQAIYDSIINNANSNANFTQFHSIDFYFFMELINMIDNGAKLNEEFPNHANPAFGTSNTAADWTKLATNFNTIFTASNNKIDLINYYWNIIMETLIALPGKNVLEIDNKAKFNQLIDDLKNASGALKIKYDKVKI